MFFFKSISTLYFNDSLIPSLFEKQLALQKEKKEKKKKSKMFHVPGWYDSI